MVWKRQQLQKAVEEFCPNTTFRDNVTPLLYPLHWPLVCFEAPFKAQCIILETQTDSGQQYLNSWCSHVYLLPLGRTSCKPTYLYLLVSERYMDLLSSAEHYTTLPSIRDSVYPICAFIYKAACAVVQRVDFTVIEPLDGRSGRDPPGSSRPPSLKESRWGIELPTSGSGARDLNHWAIQQFILLHFC